jgi:hypothetical protein
MERFTGSNAALNAPDWTSWERKTWEFQQPQLNFASLFVRMAEWEENKHEVCLCYFQHTLMLTNLFLARPSLQDGPMGEINSGE